MSYNSLFGLGSHSPDANLEGWWPLQETTGTTVNDESGNNRDGTTNGMGANPTTGTGPNDYLTSGIVLDGTDDDIDCGSAAGLKPAPGTDNYTLGMWVRPAAAGENGYLLGTASLVDDISEPDGEGSSLYFNGANDWLTLSSGIIISGQPNSNAVFTESEAWALVGSSGSGTTITYYKNGSSEGSGTGTARAAGAKQFLIGRRNDSTSAGVMLAARVASAFAFSRALSGTEWAEANNGPEPVHSVAPSISGTETEGETLTAASGTWGLAAPFASGSNGTITYAYQWTRSDDGTGTGEADISGATNSTYTLQAADVGKYIRVRVRASNNGGFDSAADTNSLFTGAIVGGDETPPTLSTATIATNGTDLVLVFSETVTSNYTGFTLSGKTLTTASGSGSGTNTLTIPIASTVGSHETLTLDYASGTGNVADGSSNALASFTGTAVTNNSTQDTLAPSLSSATIATSGDAIALVLSESCTGNNGFTISPSGGAATLTYSSGTGVNRTYSISRTIGSHETVTISYSQASGNVLDAASNELVEISGQAVTNNSTQDTVAPTLRSATFIEGGTKIRLNFSEAVNNSTGFSVDAGTISYESGDGTSTYVFTITSGSPTTISYDQGTGNVVDGAGNELETVTNQEIRTASGEGGLVRSVVRSVVRPVARSVAR